MMVNPHLEKAIQLYGKNGKSFHEVLSWHLIHGFVMIDTDWLCMGYYCNKEDIHKPMKIEESDTGFVSFLSGCLERPKTLVRFGISNVAFMRWFKNQRPVSIYPLERFEKLIK